MLKEVTDRCPEPPGLHTFVYADNLVAERGIGGGHDFANQFAGVYSLRVPFLEMTGAG